MGPCQPQNDKYTHRYKLAFWQEYGSSGSSHRLSLAMSKTAKGAIILHTWGGFSYFSFKFKTLKRHDPFEPKRLLRVCREMRESTWFHKAMERLRPPFNTHRLIMNMVALVYWVLGLGGN